MDNITDLQAAKSHSSMLFTLNEVLKDETGTNVIPVVDGILAKEEFGLLAATSKSTKTWLMMELAIAVSQGRPFLGKYPTTQGKVLFCEFELSKPRLRERLLKVSKISEQLPEQENLIFLKEHLDIQNDRDFERIGQIITALKADLVIFDPLFCLHKADENVAREILPILQKFKKMTQFNTKPAIVLVQHAGKRGEHSSGQVSHSARGSSAFGDVPDAIWFLQKTNDDTVKKFSIEQRYGEPVGPLDIKIDFSNGSWQVLGNSAVSENKGSAKDLARIVSGFTSIDKQTVQMLFCEEFNCSPRTFETRLSDAMTQGLVLRKLEGKKAYLSAPEPEIATPQPLKDLQVCEQQFPRETP